ncbi:hypothetical protein P7C70_g7649, partial [Phenoliferia sp. Uapishka_3]
MANINDLPPECILHILELTSQTQTTQFDDECDGGDTFSPDCRHYKALATLSSASRVCRQWRRPAQAVMWRHLCHTKGLQYLLRSPALGRYRTEEALFWSDTSRDREWERQIGSEELDAFLAVTHGIRKLRVLIYFAPNTIDELWLASPNLKNLDDLFLDVPFNTAAEGVTSVEFKLSALTLASDSGTRSLRFTPSVIEALFKSSAETLKSLTLEHQKPTSSIQQFFPLLSNTLETLYILGEYKGLETSLPFFTKLTDVTLELYYYKWEYADAILLALPETVTSLKVSANYTHAELLNGRIGKRPEWMRITEIIMTTTKGWFEREVPGGLDSLYAWAATGVVVRFKWSDNGVKNSLPFNQVNGKTT